MIIRVKVYVITFQWLLADDDEDGFTWRIDSLFDIWHRATLRMRCWARVLPKDRLLTFQLTRRVQRIVLFSVITHFSLSLSFSFSLSSTPFSCWNQPLMAATAVRYNLTMSKLYTSTINKWSMSFSSLSFSFNVELACAYGLWHKRNN